MSIDLKTEVAAVVAIRWDAFAERHPHLSRVIDQHLLVESAVSHLRTDPAYQHALANARAAAAGGTRPADSAVCQGSTARRPAQPGREPGGSRRRRAGR